MMNVLISMHHPFKGAQQAKCALKGCIVYEDPLNLERMRSDPDGLIICITCFVELKREYPELAVEAQMWKGKLRTPAPLDQFKKLSDWMEKKG